MNEGPNVMMPPPAGKSDEKPSHDTEFDDARMELIMGRLLQAGVLLAAGVVFAGGVVYLFAHAGERSNYRVFVARPVGLRHPNALLAGVAAGDASAIIQLGILLLVATPICRVIFAVLAFMREGDRLYVAVSLIVLAVLLFGMFRGV
jgi:uncharacterized membrane protein